MSESAIERLCREVWRSAPWLSEMVTAARAEHEARLSLILTLGKAREEHGRELAALKQASGVQASPQAAAE